MRILKENSFNLTLNQLRDTWKTIDEIVNNDPIHQLGWDPAEVNHLIQLQDKIENVIHNGAKLTSEETAEISDFYAVYVTT